MTSLCPTASRFQPSPRIRSAGRAVRHADARARDGGTLAAVSSTTKRSDFPAPGAVVHVIRRRRGAARARAVRAARDDVLVKAKRTVGVGGARLAIRSSKRSAQTHGRSMDQPPRVRAESALRARRWTVARSRQDTQRRRRELFVSVVVVVVVARSRPSYSSPTPAAVLHSMRSVQEPSW